MAVVGNVIVSDAVPLKSRGIYQGCEWTLSFMSGDSNLRKDSRDQARHKVLLFVINVHDLASWPLRPSNLLAYGHHSDNMDFSQGLMSAVGFRTYTPNYAGH